MIKNHRYITIMMFLSFIRWLANPAIISIIFMIYTVHIQVCTNLIFNLVTIVNLFWLKKKLKNIYCSSAAQSLRSYNSSKNDDGCEHRHLLIVFVVVSALWFEVDQSVQLLSTIAENKRKNHV